MYQKTSQGEICNQSVLPSRRVSALRFAAFGVFLLAQCGRQSPFSEIFAINNRPQSQSHFMVLIELSTPALLNGDAFSPRSTSGDHEILDQILTEQDTLLKRIGELSPESRIIYRYRLVMNGFAVLVPADDMPKLNSLPSMSNVHTNTTYAQPDGIATVEPNLPESIFEKNSISFIGTNKLRDSFNLRGEGVTVAVIDTGIDYGHKQFGGSGKVEDYQSNNPNIAEDRTFPSAKIIGGIDLVGSKYNANAPVVEELLPSPDPDPLDESGHGTHVAGIIAGKGDGKNTIDGVAPAADLYAIKVFGKSGSVGDEVLIAALEHAADPNQDLDPSDRFDIVNVSVGKPFGSPNSVFEGAVNNLVNAGSLVVISAGNSGGQNYVVSTPGASRLAVAVTASIDNSDLNTKSRAIVFEQHQIDDPTGDSPTSPQGLGTASHLITELVESTFSKPTRDIPNSHCYLIVLEINDDFDDPNTDQQLVNRCALVLATRKQHHLIAKKLADLGVKGVVFTTLSDETPLPLIGPRNFTDIPVVAVSRSMGDQVVKMLAGGPVAVVFNTDHFVDKSYVTDNLAGFASWGPRAGDYVIKPEVSAPGVNILSARMGGGDRGILKDGTSMAAPHIAGVAALMKQHHPSLGASALKSLLVTTAKTLQKPDGSPYPVSQQGAGRIQAEAAVRAEFLVNQPTLSVGKIDTDTSNEFERILEVRNLTANPLEISLSYWGNDELVRIIMPQTLQLSAFQARAIAIRIVVSRDSASTGQFERSGYVILKSATTTLRVPYLAMVIERHQITTSVARANDDQLMLTLKNEGFRQGSAFVFSRLGIDEKDPTGRGLERKRICDLKGVGFRSIAKERDLGEKHIVWQFAIESKEMLSTWAHCEISVQFDHNDDGIADHELVGKMEGKELVSVLYDAQRLKSLRLAYEKEYPNLPEDYMEAEVDVLPSLESTDQQMVVLQLDPDLFPLLDLQRTAVKIGLLPIQLRESDDFLAAETGEWIKVEVGLLAELFSNLPESLVIEAGQLKQVPLPSEIKPMVVVY